MDEKILQPKRPKPTVSLDETDLPAIKNWQVGQKYNISAVVKMTFQSEGDEYEYMGREGEKPKMRARFKIVSISATKEPKKKKGKTLPRVKEY